MSEFLAQLDAIIAERKRQADASGSHTAKLFAKGPLKCAEKFGEEAVEAVIAAATADRDALIAESADVLFHLGVMLASRDLTFAAVLEELARRQGVSGVAEKASRAVRARVTRADDDLATCLAIRHTVFVEEQNVPEHEEIDGLDSECSHYLGWIEGQPVATARTRMVGNTLKVQRVAVLAAVRGRGVGADIMRHIMDEAVDAASVETVLLSAQEGAFAFYERLGFTAEGDVYLDAGIPHRDMRWHPTTV